MKQDSRTKRREARALPRRAALQQLGALAVALPALGTLGCAADEEPGRGPGAGPLEGADSGVSGASPGPTQSSATDSGAASLDAGAPGPAAPSTGANDAAALRDAEPPATASDAAPSDARMSEAAVGDAAAGVGPEIFDDAASCSLTTTDIEGPFLIEESEIPNDASMVRSDIREGMKGCEFRFHFRLLDAKQRCSPIANAQVYIWHCNADGIYSGFNGQDPNKPYTGAAQRTPENMERFCRGIQMSNAQGIVSFTTVYPGWYAGRPIHVHLIARTSETAPRLITTQLYFPAAFTTEVHTSEPDYMARAAAIPAGSRNPPSGRPAMPTLKHTPGLIVGTLNVIVNG